MLAGYKSRSTCTRMGSCHDVTLILDSIAPTTLGQLDTHGGRETADGAVLTPSCHIHAMLVFCGKIYTEIFKMARAGRPLSQLGIRSAMARPLGTFARQFASLEPRISHLTGGRLQIY